MLFVHLLSTMRVTDIKWIYHPKDQDLKELPWKWFYEYLKENKNKKTSAKTIKNKQNDKVEIKEIECERLHDKQHIENAQHLSQERVDNYQSWIDVGLCLFNSEKNPNEYFSLWKEWSKKVINIKMANAKING